MLDWLFPWRWALRQKLVAIACLSLMVPAGLLQLARELEQVLIDANIEKLVIKSELLAQNLKQHPEWLSSQQIEDARLLGQHIYVFPLSNRPQIDGYLNEWATYQPFKQVFPKRGSQFLSLQAASFQDKLLFGVEIHDDLWLWNEPEKPGDQLEWQILDSQGRVQRLLLSPSAPGEISAKVFKEDEWQFDWRYQASLIETIEGASIELRIPGVRSVSGVKVRWIDHDGVSKTPTLIETTSVGYNPIIWPSTALVNWLEGLPLKGESRVWILKSDGRVLAKHGALKPQAEALSPIWSALLGRDNFAVPVVDDNAMRLHLESVFKALGGEKAGQLIVNSNGLRRIVAAAPIMKDGQTLGVILLEESVAQALLTQHKNLNQVLTAAILFILVLLMVVAWFGGRLASRINGLSQQIKEAIEPNGKVKVLPAPPTVAEDEIDKLRVSFSALSQQLADYHDYLEKMASRLVHELRTPIAIVRSSLDTLKISGELNSEQQDALKRALQGSQRMSDIILRLREASSVREAIKQGRLEPLAIDQFITEYINGYAQAFNQHQYQLQTEHALWALANQELLAECLDKLLSNAADFANDGTPIEVSASGDQSYVYIRVTNQGKAIARRNLKRIFYSLLSLRDGEQRSGHLGLGLYVAKLIADFHGGKIWAENEKESQRVHFILRLPRIKPAR